MYSQWAIDAVRKSKPNSIRKFISSTDAPPATSWVTKATCPFFPEPLVFGGMHMIELGRQVELTVNPAARAALGQLSALPQSSGHGLPITCDPHHAAPLTHSRAM